MLQQTILSIGLIEQVKKCVANPVLALGAAIASPTASFKISL